MPSAILEEYLEAIYKLCEEGDVRPGMLAERLCVSGATVTATLGRLERDGFITRPERGVVLTKTGEAEALWIIRRHRLAERLLVDVLGMSLDAAHEEACLLEHALSDRVLGALDSTLSNPRFCPHGYPIPDVDLVMRVRPTRSLNEVVIGDEVVVVSVKEDDEHALRYLESVGLIPGALVSVLSLDPVDSTLSVRVDGKQLSLGPTMADHVDVSVDGTPPAG